MTPDDVLVILATVIALIGIAILVREGKAHSGQHR